MCEEDGLELVNVELVHQGRRMAIRVLLDKPGGITLGDCARFSRRLADCLDMNQTVPGSYLLEVSSPGIERPLPTLEAVSRFVGQRAGVTLREPRDGRRVYDGVLLDPREGRAGLREENGNEVWFEWSDVRAARLIVDPWAGTRKPGGGRHEHGGARRERSGEGRHE